MFENLRVLFRGTLHSESQPDGSHEAILESETSRPVAIAHGGVLIAHDVWAQAFYEAAREPNNLELQIQLEQAAAEQAAASDEYRQALVAAGHIQAL